MRLLRDGRVVDLEVRLGHSFLDRIRNHYLITLRKAHDLKPLFPSVEFPALGVVNLPLDFPSVCNKTWELGNIDLLVYNVLFLHINH